ncbi:LLM class flavin-dependent oxidoreductase [Streptomyces sp. NPDC088337]|uniref:LLM class flavin-dependent oxidoreductase n=1 Tax=unclassified Streptomyces TaxID=2593676 RepID=UPI0037FA54A7
MPKISVFFPFGMSRPEMLVPFAAYVQHSAAHRLWQGQAFAVDSYQSLSFAAGLGFRVPVGVAVSLMPLRHPYDAALQARSLAVATGNSVVAGFGPGAKSFQESLLGQAYRKPLVAVREYVTAVRGLLAEGFANQSGEEFHTQAVLQKLATPPIEIGLGVLRPGMARLAGAVADVAICWMAPLRYLVSVVQPALQQGADGASRNPPRIVTVVPMAIAKPDRDPARLVLAGNFAHLRLPHYQSMFALAGVPLDASDPEASARALVEKDVFLYGTAQELATKIRAYWSAGVDEVVINLAGVHRECGMQAALSEIEEIVSEVADR